MDIGRSSDSDSRLVASTPIDSGHPDHGGGNGNGLRDAVGKDALGIDWLGKSRKKVKRTCKHCGDSFPTSDPDALYCCKAHGNAAWQKIHRSKKNTTIRPVVN